MSVQYNDTILGSLHLLAFWPLVLQHLLVGGPGQTADFLYAISGLQDCLQMLEMHGALQCSLVDLCCTSVQSAFILSLWLSLHVFKSQQ